MRISAVCASSRFDNTRMVQTLTLGPSHVTKADGEKNFEDQKLKIHPPCRDASPLPFPWVSLIVLPRSCSCRWGPCPRPIPPLGCLFSFFSREKPACFLSFHMDCDRSPACFVSVCVESRWWRSSHPWASRRRSSPTEARMCARERSRTLGVVDGGLAAALPTGLG